MLITIGGNAPLASSGCTIDSPSFTLSCTWAIAPEITVLPAVARVMFSACKIGTPLVTNVPRVREKREIAVFRSEEHTSELQSQSNLVCRLLLEKKKK